MRQTPNDPRQVPAVPGDQVGRYVIEKEIGHGGMGVVFRARDLELDRHVALKFPWPDTDEKDRSLRRFRREARASSNLSHPNIVPVIEILEHKGLPCLVLQLIEGEDLRVHLKRNAPIDAGRILRMSEDVGKALAHAHSHRVLHRDVNPKNIMITPDDRALLTDFGLARALPGSKMPSSETTASSSLTARGVTIGTPRYMSPEQALGRELDERSDIFSFGTVMYEMCTGSPAFSGGETGELYDQIIHGEPKPIASFSYEIPTEFERIIRKCMAKRPDERYQNVDDLLVDLRSLRRDLDYEKYSSTHGYGDQKNVDPRRHRRSARALVLVALPLIALASWYAFLRRDDGLPKGRPTQVTDSEAWEGDPALSPDGKQIAYASDASGNLDVWVIGVEGGEPLQLTDDPGEDRHPFWFPDGSAVGFSSNRTGEWAVWKVGRLGGGATMIAPQAMYGAVSPEGDRLAVQIATELATTHTVIGLVDLEQRSEPRHLTRANEGFWHHATPSWSPDGRMICYADFNTLWLVSSLEGRARRLIDDARFDHDPVWSPSGRHIYFSSYRDDTQAIWRLRVSSGRLERVTMGTGPESRPDVSDDGRKLVYGTGASDQDVALLDRESGSVTRLPGVTVVMSIAPRADRILYARSGSRNRVDLWEQLLEGGKPAGPPRKLTDHPGMSTHPALSPDGKWIAYYRGLDGHRSVWVVSAHGGEPVALGTGDATTTMPVWSPDGSRLAYLSDRGGVRRVWSVAMAAGRATGEHRALTPANMNVFGAAWSPDGESLAFVASQEQNFDVFVVRGSGGEPRQITRGANAQRVRWDPATDQLLVSGGWGGDRLRLRSVSPDGEESEPLDLSIEFGRLDAPALFDVDAEGKLLVYARSNLRGDIWLLEAEDGEY